VRVCGDVSSSSRRRSGGLAARGAGTTIGKRVSHRCFKSTELDFVISTVGVLIEGVLNMSPGLLGMGGGSARGRRASAAFPIPDHLLRRSTSPLSAPADSCTAANSILTVHCWDICRRVGEAGIAKDVPNKSFGRIAELNVGPDRRRLATTDN
jgi:hypothetical protein